MPRRPLSVLLAAAECAPFVKVGGLGDVIGSLPQAVAEHNVTVSVILPCYGSISRKRFRFTKVSSLSVTHGGRAERCTLLSARLPRNPVQYFFIDHRFFRPREIYLHQRRHTSKKTYTRTTVDVDRFALFSQAVAEAACSGAIPVDVIHCHDWHTALIPTFVDQLSVEKNYPNIPTVYTIHNLANQGIVRRSFIRRIDMRPDEEPALMEDYYDMDNEQLNFMKLGVLSANSITTVSPTYAREIRTPEYGAGLAKFLERRRQDVRGIVNGIDTRLFDPEHDTAIARRYTAQTVRTAKPVNKDALQKILGLARAKDIPVYGLVSRLVPQKGLDITEEALKKFLRHEVQVVFLGTGDPGIERRLTALAKRFLGSVSVTIGFDLALAQQIYAGSDFFLMPSLFEPCGLGQMIAMRYGTVPIVRATGGLKDTVTNGKTGITFTRYTGKAFLGALEHSRKLYADEKSWYSIVARCMREDFSWTASATRYKQLYTTLL